MTEFDHFLQKTEEILEARRAAIESLAGPGKKALPAKQDPGRLGRLSSLEWSKLLLSVTDQTNGKSINKDRFLAYGRTGVMLGKIILMLKPVRDGHNGGLEYFAEYRSSSPDGGVTKLAEVTIEPEFAETPSRGHEIAWRTFGLDENKQLATSELAMVLAMKLVDVYQANQELK